MVALTGHDCFVGLLETGALPAELLANQEPDGGVWRDAAFSIADLVKGRTWEDAVLGMFCALVRLL